MTYDYQLTQELQIIFQSYFLCAFGRASMNDCKTHILLKPGIVEF